jgi:Cd2+/Zn2+-exporting ATPase
MNGGNGHDEAVGRGDADGHGHVSDVESDGTQAPGDATFRASVPSMDCPSCAGKVEGSVRSLSGVTSVDPRPASGTLVVHYDADATSDVAIRDRVEAAGYDVADTESETFEVPSMDCPSCAGTVESALSRVDGVVDYDTRPASGRVAVTYDPARATRGDVVAGIENAGYEVIEGERETESIWRSRRAVKTGVGALLLLAGIVVEYLGVPNPTLTTVLGRAITLDGALYLLAAAVAGQEILRNGWYSARNRSLDIDFLMSAGVIGAVAVDLPFEAATLAVLFSISELLERYSMDRARTSMSELMDLSPDTATVVRGVSETPRSDGDAAGGEEETVAVEDVAVGEIVVVRPGERVPVDGVVREGTSAVDESPITGESIPVDVTAGDEVYAGSIVEEGYLEVETTAPAGESTLSKVIDLVEEAERDKSERERFVDRFANYYTPAVVALAVVTAAAPPLFLGAPFETWFTRGLTLLVIACPCAFVISTPVSVVSGITSAARNGVLIKGGDRLEAMGEVDAVALDKTGTITTGELGVTDVVALNGTTEDEVLRCAAALERRSEHPIAGAIVEYASGNRSAADDRDVTDFQSITGEGVRADIDGVTHYAGKPALFESLGFDLEHTHVETDGGVAVDDVEPEACEHGTYLDLVNDVLPRLQAGGKTAVLVGTEDELEGVIAVADTVRPEAERTIARLREAGIDRVVMLTGDNERTARAIAAQVGIDADDVYADLLPEEKVEVVQELAAESADADDARLPWNRSGGGVAMVGDGVNDAPALAAATVGVAMGAAGTDTAIETADVALMGDDLTRLPYLVALARRANRVIETNVWSSLGVKAILAAGAPFGLVSVVHAVVIGDMGMSLAVTGNAMRLANVTPDDE